MKPGGMHRRYRFVSCIAIGDTEKEGPAGQRGSLFKGPDAAVRPPGFIPPGGGWRASRRSVTLVARSTCYASTRVPRLARPAPPARRRWVLLRPLRSHSGIPMSRRPRIVISLGDPCGIGPELLLGLSLIHISEPTRRTPISYAVF